MTTKGNSSYNSLIINTLSKISTINKWRQTFLLEAFMLFLSIKGRINFLQLERYGKYTEQRYRQQFEKAFEVIDKINIVNKNKRYSKYLIPILERKINVFLIKNNDPELNAKLAKSITNSSQLYKIYWAAKQDHVTFEAKILSLKNNDIER